MLDFNWTQITAAGAAGAGLIYGLQRARSGGELARVQAEAITVDTLRDVIVELRAELDRVQGKLEAAEALIVRLTGGRLPDGLLDPS